MIGALFPLTLPRAPRYGPASPPLASSGGARYSACVAETTTTGFGDPYKVRRTSATRRIFYVRMPLRASFNGRALAGRPSGLPVASFAGSPTPSCARSPRLATGSGFPAQKGGRTMRHISARPEQKQSPNQRLALFTESGHHAALLWVQFAPLTAADFRDLRFRNLVAGLGHIEQFGACLTAFNDAFAASLAKSIAGTALHATTPDTFPRFPCPEQSSSMEAHA